jgi:hypothetical protein
MRDASLLLVAVVTAVGAAAACSQIIGIDDRVPYPTTGAGGDAHGSAGNGRGSEATASASSGNAGQGGSGGKGGNGGNGGQIGATGGGCVPTAAENGSSGITTTTGTAISNPCGATP